MTRGDQLYLRHPTNPSLSGPVEVVSFGLASGCPLVRGIDFVAYVEFAWLSVITSVGACVR